jgi:poly-gamma-glutamate synthesis protein (capsule biosynthesis protein)
MMPQKAPAGFSGWCLLFLFSFPLLFSGGCLNSRGKPADVPTTSATVTLALLGDVVLGRGVQASDESFAYLQPFITSADVALANLESPLTTARPRSGLKYVLCAPPENASFLQYAGIDLLSFANNHVDDCGAAGALETRSVLDGAGMGLIDPGSQPVYWPANGIPLAFLAFDATADFDVEEAVAAVSSAADIGALVVVSMHWGAEYQAGASSEQVEIARRLSDAGAALVWGHHPHVLQPSEWINNGKTLVFYSLGNALFDQYGLAGTRRSAMVLVRLDREVVTDFRAIPFVIDVRRSQVQRPDAQDEEMIMKYLQPRRSP